MKIKEQDHACLWAGQASGHQVLGMLSWPLGLPFAPLQPEPGLAPPWEQKTEEERGGRRESCGEEGGGRREGLCRKRRGEALR